jgi:hypothetical protein
MNFKEIYSKCTLVWPESIDLSDGELIEETKGFYSENLSLAWDRAEELVTDEWQSLMVWIFYQELHKKAIEYFMLGRHSLKVASIDLSILEHSYIDTLNEEGYEKMLNQFDK